jgi:hypothetical protein
LPFADGQRILDDRRSAKVQDRGLTDVRDQKDERHQKRKRPCDLHLLRQQCIRGAIEAFLLLWLARKCLDDSEPGKVFL